MWLWIVAALAGPFDAVDAATSPAAKIEALLPLTEGETAPEANQRLAQAFTLSGKLPLALLYHARALEADPELDTAGAALQLAETVGDVSLVALALQDRKVSPGDGDKKSANAVLVARELLRDGQLTKAETWLAQVGGDTPAFADAESLRGVVLASKGKHKDALVPLQTAKALGVSLDKGDRFAEKVQLNIARSYYADKNYGQAIYHYSLVPRDSEFWAEARFEKAWAHFRANDVPGAVAELQTHQSPFFDELWFPEAWMLRAQSLFVMCRYGAAVKAMDSYEERYQPVLDDLSRALASMDDVGAYDAVDTYLTDGTSDLPETVLRAYRTEDRIAEARKAVATYESAATGVADLGAQSATFAKELSDRATTLRKTEGDRIFDRAKLQKRELGSMIAGLELARIDILDKESQMLSRAAATGNLEAPDRKAELKKISREKKGYRVWPFQGEYWVDELGWYQVSALSQCPEKK